MGHLVDVNTALTTGTYVIDGSAINRPDPDDTYLLIVFSDNTYASQIAFKLNSPFDVYYRRVLIYLDNYTSWRRLN